MRWVRGARRYRVRIHHPGQTPTSSLPRTIRTGDTCTGKPVLVRPLPRERCKLPARPEAFLRAADVPLHHFVLNSVPVASKLHCRHALAVAPTTRLCSSSIPRPLYRTRPDGVVHGSTSDAHPGLGGHPIVSSMTERTDCGIPRGRRSTGHFEHMPPFRRACSMPCRTHAMFAGTVNAYRRYAWELAPRTATWGIGNYTCALRVVNGHPMSAASSSACRS